MTKNLWWYLILRGVFALALGAFALFWPSLTIGVLVTVIGIFCLIDGSIGLAFTLRNPELREYLAVALLTPDYRRCAGDLVRGRREVRPGRVRRVAGICGWRDRSCPAGVCSKTTRIAAC